MMSSDSVYKSSDSNVITKQSVFVIYCHFRYCRGMSSTWSQHCCLCAWSSPVILSGEFAFAWFAFLFLAGSCFGGLVLLASCWRVSRFHSLAPGGSKLSHLDSRCLCSIRVFPYYPGSSFGTMESCYRTHPGIRISYHLGLEAYRRTQNASLST